MKKLLYFLCLLCGVVGTMRSAKAQIVNIPNSAFKARLIQVGVDTNNDGEIQVTEAHSVDSLDVGSNLISNMTGIEAFVNLTYLKCSENQLTSLDVSNNTALNQLWCFDNQLTSLDVSNNTALNQLDCYGNALTSLYLSNNTVLAHLNCGYNQLTSLYLSNNTVLAHLNCGYNQLTSLDVSNNINLEWLSCSYNQLTSLDVSNNINLEWLSCGHNQLTSLDVSNNTALNQLGCDNNQLTSLDVSNNTALTHLGCGYNQLTSLDGSNNTVLLVLHCQNNQLTSLDVSNNTALTHLGCDNNQLTSLDVSNNTALTYLYCYNNQLTSLNLSSNTALADLYCYNNQLTSLNLSSNTALADLYCDNNQLTSLDVSNNTTLTVLGCDNNPMTTLFVKNGQITSFGSLTNCPNLTYICADAAEIGYVQNAAPNALVSTFCTYAPGGNYNTLSGQTSLDIDMNGCTATDPAYSFAKILISNGTNSGYLYTNQQGNYFAPLSMGNYSVSPEINPVYFSANNATISFPNNNNNVQTQDFCITPNGVSPDVAITFIPIDVARPGFDSDYQIHYKNIGTTVANGNITLDFEGNKMNFLNASIAPTSQTANQLTWAYSNLQPFESRTINITMNTLPPPTNNINDQISFDANISLANDANLFDNSSTLKQILVGAYDPNDKTCLEGQLLHNDKIGDYLHYLIRFQNTGNFPAEFVVIVDTLNAAKYDLASLQIIETSHDAHIDLKSNVLQFYFENIQLADSFSNEPESHGFVVYKIKTKSTMPDNSSVSNKAEIYFDYNLPIVTNLETTTFSDFVGIADATQQAHFQCYPNPTQNTLTIETTKSEQFFMLNVMGETVKTFAVNGKENIDISNLPQGMYFLKAKGESRGVSFVKE